MTLSNRNSLAKLWLLLIFLFVGHRLWAQTVASEDLVLDEPSFAWQWGGWLGASYADNDLAGADDHFDLNQAYLFGDLRFAEKWQVFGEGSFEQDVNAFGEQDRETKLERLFVNYKKDRGLQFRLGRFNTRSGIVKPLHWDITLDTVQPPVMESNDYVPAKSNGLEVWGTRLGRSGVWHYSLSLSHSDDEIDPREPILEARAFGADLSYQRPSVFRVGGSLSFYADPADRGRNVLVLLPYFEWWIVPQKLLWRTEAMVLNPSSGDSLDSLYTKLKWQVNDQIYLNYRFDNGHDLRIGPDVRHRVNSLTLAYWPHNQWRWKAEVARHDVERDLLPAFTQWSIWTGYVF